MGNHDTAPHKSVYENQSTGLFKEMEKGCILCQGNANDVNPKGRVISKYEASSGMGEKHDT